MPLPTVNIEIILVSAVIFVRLCVRGGLLARILCGGVKRRRPRNGSGKGGAVDSGGTRTGAGRHGTGRLVDRGISGKLNTFVYFVLIHNKYYF